MRLGPSVCDFKGLACAERYGLNRVSVVFVYDEYILVSSGGLDREFASLVRVGLLDVRGGQDTSVDCVGCGVHRFLDGLDVERGVEFCGVQIFLFHSQVALAGSRGLWQVLCDQRLGDDRP